MFESLSDRLGKIFDGLRGRGALNEADVDAALREVRRALLEADVSLEVVKAFIEQIRERAVGAEVTRSVNACCRGTSRRCSFEGRTTSIVVSQR